MVSLLDPCKIVDGMMLLFVGTGTQWSKHHIEIIQH